MNKQPSLYCEKVLEKTRSYFIVLKSVFFLFFSKSIKNFHIRRQTEKKHMQLKLVYFFKQALFFETFVFHIYFYLCTFCISVLLNSFFYILYYFNFFFTVHVHILMFH